MSKQLERIFGGGEANFYHWQDPAVGGGYEGKLWKYNLLENIYVRYF